MEPIVKILYSESNIPGLTSGTILSLGAANGLFERRDADCIDNHEVESVTYEIEYSVEDDIRTCCFVQTLGNGAGSVINHIRNVTIESLESFKAVNFRHGDSMAKNPFDILRSSCENMLSFVLPELERYCLAYKAYDIISSYEVDNCHPRLSGDVDSIVQFIQSSPGEFIRLFEDVILKNPQNISLIVAIENLIEKTERYCALLNGVRDNSENLAQIIKDATRKATMINAKSILYGVEPPYIPTRDSYEY